jgi:opacity protein-like surface antigen
MRSRILIAISLLLIASELAAQTKPRTPPLLRRSIRILGGYAWPVSREPWLKYWTPGPTASIEFMTRVSQQFWLGVSADGSGFWFRAGKFTQLNPGAQLRNIPIALLTVDLAGRLDLSSGKRWTPYFAFSAGIGKVSEAVYIETINSVRVIRFNIPGRTRLQGGLAGGVELQLSRKVAVDAEVKGTYIHNDPAVGWNVAGRGGLRFLF